MSAKTEYNYHKPLEWLAGELILSPRPKEPAGFAFSFGRGASPAAPEAPPMMSSSSALSCVFNFGGDADVKQEGLRFVYSSQEIVRRLCRRAEWYACRAEIMSGMRSLQEQKRVADTKVTVDAGDAVEHLREYLSGTTKNGHLLLHRICRHLSKHGGEEFLSWILERVPSAASEIQNNCLPLHVSANRWHYECDSGGYSFGVMTTSTKSLPLHVAICHDAPSTCLSALLRAFPSSAATPETTGGNLPLHLLVSRAEPNTSEMRHLLRRDRAKWTTMLLFCAVSSTGKRSKVGALGRCVMEPIVQYLGVSDWDFYYCDIDEHDVKRLLRLFPDAANSRNLRDRTPLEEMIASYSRFYVDEDVELEVSNCGGTSRVRCFVQSPAPNDSRELHVAVEGGGWSDTHSVSSFALRKFLDTRKKKEMYEHHASNFWRAARHLVPTKVSVNMVRHALRHNLPASIVAKLVLRCRADTSDDCNDVPLLPYNSSEASGIWDLVEKTFQTIETQHPDHAFAEFDVLVRQFSVWGTKRDTIVKRIGEMLGLIRAPSRSELVALRLLFCNHKQPAVCDMSKGDELKRIAGVSNSRWLEWLDTSGVQELILPESVTDEEMLILFGDGRFSELATLNLMGCVNITDASVLEVGRCCSKLQSLNLFQCNRITDAGLAALSLCLKLGLVCDMDGDDDGSKLYRAMVRLSNSRFLQWLDTSGVQELILPESVTDEEMLILFGDGRFSELRTLNLYECERITDASVSAVARRCSNLQSLNLGWNENITDACKNALRQAHPKLQLRG